MLHVARFRASELGQVIEDINATGYGLTLGLHSRIAETRRFVQARARRRQFLCQRNQIGAVVESQPFGGEGLSGTGPKAGGPHYLARFATERVDDDRHHCGGRQCHAAGSRLTGALVSGGQARLSDRPWSDTPPLNLPPII